eukprot:Lankesteria_metandrocarpae@DN5012_c2_g1_i1.p1
MGTAETLHTNAVESIVASDSDRIQSVSTTGSNLHNHNSSNRGRPAVMSNYITSDATAAAADISCTVSGGAVEAAVESRSRQSSRERESRTTFEGESGAHGDFTSEFFTELHTSEQDADGGRADADCSLSLVPEERRIEVCEGADGEIPVGVAVGAVPCDSQSDHPSLSDNALAARDDSGTYETFYSSTGAAVAAAGAHQDTASSRLSSNPSTGTTRLPYWYRRQSCESAPFVKIKIQSARVAKNESTTALIAVPTSAVATAECCTPSSSFGRLGLSAASVTSNADSNGIMANNPDDDVDSQEVGGDIVNDGSSSSGSSQAQDKSGRRRVDGVEFSVSPHQHVTTQSGAYKFENTAYRSVFTNYRGEDGGAPPPYGMSQVEDVISSLVSSLRDEIVMSETRLRSQMESIERRLDTVGIIDRTPGEARHLPLPIITNQNRASAKRIATALPHAMEVPTDAGSSPLIVHSDRCQFAGELFVPHEQLIPCRNAKGVEINCGESCRSAYYSSLSPHERHINLRNISSNTAVIETLLTDTAKSLIDNSFLNNMLKERVVDPLVSQMTAFGKDSVYADLRSIAAGRLEGVCVDMADSLEEGITARLDRHMKETKDEMRVRLKTMPGFGQMQSELGSMNRTIDALTTQFQQSQSHKDDYAQAAASKLGLRLDNVQKTVDSMDKRLKITADEQSSVLNDIHSFLRRLPTLSADGSSCSW